jgi:Holliday junction resolvase-like predicted endonuclease
MATERQRRGAWAEGVAADHLAAHGWSVLARNVVCGKDEIDLLCVDPEPPAELVFVEVRSLRVAAFGAPEERVDAAKVSRLYRSMSALRATGRLPDGTPLPRLPVRVDLVVVDGRGDAVEVRHIARLMPP